MTNEQMQVMSLVKELSIDGVMVLNALINESNILNLPLFKLKIRVNLRVFVFYIFENALK